MTKINFKRSGGLMGQQVDTDIDLNELPDAEAQELMQLIAETSFFNIPQNMIGHTTPDEYEYVVTVEAGNSHHTIQTSDTNAPDSLRPLLDRLSQLSRPNDARASKL